MPIRINEVEAEVEVDSAASSAGAATEPQGEAEALERWRELARREQQLAARTAAFAFDD